MCERERERERERRERKREREKDLKRDIEREREIAFTRTASSGKWCYEGGVGGFEGDVVSRAITVPERE